MPHAVSLGLLQAEWRSPLLLWTWGIRLQVLDVLCLRYCRVRDEFDGCCWHPAVPGVVVVAAEVYCGLALAWVSTAVEGGWVEAGSGDAPACRLLSSIPRASVPRPSIQWIALLYLLAALRCMWWSSLELS
eukprot:2960291-Amphidinium_carterae.1